MSPFWKEALRKNSVAQPASARTPRNVFQPQLEQLEEKVLLSVFSPTYMVHGSHDHGPASPAGGTAFTGAGLTPTQVRSAYGINGITFQGSGGTIAGTGSGQTIA